MTTGRGFSSIDPGEKCRNPNQITEVARFLNMKFFDVVRTWHINDCSHLFLHWLNPFCINLEAQVDDVRGHEDTLRFVEMHPRCLETGQHFSECLQMF